jgi:hypothetical protein
MSQCLGGTRVDNCRDLYEEYGRSFTYSMHLSDEAEQDSKPPWATRCL